MSSLPLPVMVSTILWPYTSCTHDASVSTNTNWGIPDLCFLLSLSSMRVWMLMVLLSLVSRLRVSTKIAVDPPLLRVPCFGPQTMRPLATSSGYRIQCVQQGAYLWLWFLWPGGVCRKGRRSWCGIPVRYSVPYAASWYRHRRAVLLLCCKSPGFGPIPGVIAIEETVFRFGLHLLTRNTIYWKIQCLDVVYIDIL